jgi:hypothetical protein
LGFENRGSYQDMALAMSQLRPSQSGSSRFMKTAAAEAESARLADGMPEGMP